MAGEQCEPRVGDWHKNARGVSFEVITIDAEERLVEIQYLDGSVERLDFERWRAARFTPREPPQEWRGAFAMLLAELGGEEPALQPTVWTGPLDTTETEMEWRD